MYVILLADCGIPETPTNGVVKYNGTVTGSIAHYKCNKGCLIGDVQRICDNKGHWSGNATCYCELFTKIIILICYMKH